jgi:hypothetical protein
MNIRPILTCGCSPSRSESCITPPNGLGPADRTRFCWPIWGRNVANTGTLPSANRTPRPVYLSSVGHTTPFSDRLLTNCRFALNLIAITQRHQPATANLKPAEDSLSAIFGACRLSLSQWSH